MQRLICLTKYCGSGILCLFLLSPCVLLLGCAANYIDPRPSAFDMQSFVLQDRADAGSMMLFVSYKDSAICEALKPNNHCKQASNHHTKEHGHVYYFALFDSLGTPLAHKKFVDSRFYDLKLLPPKRYYDDLFFYVLEMIARGDKEQVFHAHKKHIFIRAYTP